MGVLAGAGEYEDGSLTGFTPAPYVMGLGKIDGRHVAIGGEDFTIRGGSAKQFKQRDKGGDTGGFPEDVAREYLIPLVLLIEGGGGNVQSIASDGAPPLFAGNYQFQPAVEAMMYVPVVGAVLGYAAGGPAGRSQLVHWSVMTKETSAVFAAGPPVVRRTMGQELTPFELGGAHIHVRESGCIDNEAADEEDAFRQVRAFLSYMPSNIYELPPVAEFNDAPPDPEPLADIVPRDRRRPYSMHKILRSTLDEGSIFEIKPHYGLSLITAFARINGHPVGVIANNPLAYGGRARRRWRGEAGALHRHVRLLPHPARLLRRRAGLRDRPRGGARCHAEARHPRRLGGHAGHGAGDHDHRAQVLRHGRHGPR